MPIFFTLFHTLNRLLDGYFFALYTLPRSDALAPHLQPVINDTLAQMDALIRLGSMLQAHPERIEPDQLQLCSELRALIDHYSSCSPAPQQPASLAPRPISEICATLLQSKRTTLRVFMLRMASRATLRINPLRRAAQTARSILLAAIQFTIRQMTCKSWLHFTIHNRLPPAPT